MAEHQLLPNSDTAEAEEEAGKLWSAGAARALVGLILEICKVF